MVSKDTLDLFLGKKVYIKIIDDKVQFGILKKLNGDYILENQFNRTVIEPNQIARVTIEKPKDGVEHD